MAEIGDEAFLGLHNPEVHKVNVEIDMLDYAYIDKCDSPNELRAILKVLLSGKEGKYPHLEKTTVEKLIELLPINERKRIQNLRSKPSRIDMEREQAELSNWLRDMNEKVLFQDKEPGDEQNYIFIDKGPDFKKLSEFPPPRNDQTVTRKLKSNIGEAKTKKHSVQKSQRYDRLCKEKLSNHDYFRAWEKNDIEALENEVDNEDCKAVMKSVLADDGNHETNLKKRLEKKQHEISKLREKINASSFTMSERKYMANMEKYKGNEFFRNKDFQDAISCYTKSIALDASNIKLYTNRAIASIRLNNLQQAVSDCTTALKINPSYTKALMHRGMVYHKRGQYQKAKDDFQKCLEIEPESKYFPQLMKCSEKKLKEVEGDRLHQETKRKIRIEEVPMISTDPKCDSDVKQESETIEEIFTPGALEIMNSKRTNKSLKSCTERRQDEPNVAEYETFYKINIVEDDDESDYDSTDNIVDDSDSWKVKCHSLDIKASEDLKKRGNIAMGKQKYQDATQFYDKAIEKNPTNIAAINNRSLSFLKLNQGDKAEADANHCLQHEPENIKALYRRGLARKMQGQEKKIYDACEDFRRVLQIDPKNSYALNELKSCEFILQAKDYGQLLDESNATSNTILTSQVNLDLPIPPPIQKLQEKTRDAPTTPKSPTQCSVNAKSETNNLLVTKSVSDISLPFSKSKGISCDASFAHRQDSRISPVPKTTSEMESTIKGMKSQDITNSITSYLGQFVRKDFKKLFKTTLSPDVLTIIFLSLENSFNTQRENVFSILFEIARISPAIDITFKCMDEKGRKSIQNLMTLINNNPDKRKGIIQKRYQKCLS